ncbi:MAG: hypothetical protein CO163_04675 [Rhodobacterales bacterium CG_4_9_14_3_um_filter_71_31]|nr:MAG: hypothetical protein CO163_04675 [Rhodobacterales bacterium CG_4_9_14_3_um_filter_71_31]
MLRPVRSGSGRVSSVRCLHADRGGPMKAKATALMLADLGVVKSHSRPHTSNVHITHERPNYRSEG